ncbi:MAG: histidinol dehydrogenase [Bacteroidota bacterium]
MKILDAQRSLREALRLADRRTLLDPAIEARAREIIALVRTEGDEALTTLTRRLDCRFIDAVGLRVSEREIRGAYTQVGRDVLRALRLARRNVERFHRRQVLRSWELRGNGIRLAQRVRPLQRVGIYIPGGKASYPSTVLMNAIPARIAGVREIVLVSPPSGEGKLPPSVLVAAAECNISEIYRIGGAQAIAALTYGTESIRRVDKITGPGNAYVAAAKRLVYGDVGIDMIAGPTEVVIIADNSATPEYVAADLIAQAEHDENASPIVITTSARLAEALPAVVSDRLERMERKTIARKALERQGVIILVRRLEDAGVLVNYMAPEHVELIVRSPRRLAGTIDNAGAIFLGPFSTEALGDYVAGPNHTLPTSGSARFSSPLGVSDFLKTTNLIEVQRRALVALGPAAEILAAAEGLTGHAASVQVRREKL